MVAELSSPLTEKTTRYGHSSFHHITHHAFYRNLLPAELGKKQTQLLTSGSGSIYAVNSFISWKINTERIRKILVLFLKKPARNA
jgi:hypothetical protein